MQVDTCRICGNNDGNMGYTAREMMYGLRHEFYYFQCPSCRCLQISDFPDDMSDYYPKGYYSFNAYDGKKFRGILGPLKRFQYKSSVFPKGPLARLIRAVLPVPDYRVFDGRSVTQQTRILDVGCGNGRSFLYPLAEVGLKQLLGADPYIGKEIQYPNGLRIRPVSIHGVDGEWDIITYHHSFEHVADPQENMHAVAKLLSDNGMCVIRIPTASSWAWEHYRCNWAQLDAPRHFFLHSVESMRLLAEKAGLELTSVVYDSRHFQFSGSEKLVANIPLSAPRPKGLLALIRRKLKKMEYVRRAKELNRLGQGDQAAFFFRKKGNP